MSAGFPRACAVVLVALASGLASAAERPRFVVEASLVRSAAMASADQRFALRAGLAPADRTQRGGPFALDAAFKSPAKAVAAVCTPRPDNLFGNGFETP
jgi:hypothetical protein